MSYTRIKTLLEHVHAMKIGDRKMKTPIARHTSDNEVKNVQFVLVLRIPNESTVSQMPALWIRMIKDSVSANKGIRVRIVTFLLSMMSSNIMSPHIGGRARKIQVQQSSLS